jgi:hypothetical protein
MANGGRASAPLTSSKPLCSGLPGGDLKAHLELGHQRLRERARNADARKAVQAFAKQRMQEFTGNWYVVCR